MISALRCVALVLAGVVSLRGAAPIGPDGQPGSPAIAARSIYSLNAAWTSDTGRQIRLAGFRGHPVVLAMFFTRCQGACPLIVAGMRRIQAALPAATRAEARFVLISFDSARDTSATLRAYRQGLGLPEATWTLLAGDPADVQELAMVLGVQYQQVGDGQYAHSNLVTILDRQGEIAFQRAGVAGDDRAMIRALALALR